MFSLSSSQYNLDILFIKYGYFFRKNYGIFFSRDYKFIIFEHKYISFYNIFCSLLIESVF